VPVPIVAGAIALVAPVLGVNVPALDMVGPIVAGKLLGGPGAVLVLIVVFSSLASSLDSLLAATSDLLVQDIYHCLVRPRATDRELRAASRAIVVGLGALAVALCWFRPTTLARLIQFTGAFVAAAIWPVAAGLYWPAANRRAATVAMVAGSLGGLTAYITIGFYTAALVAAAISMICVVVGRLLGPESFQYAGLARQGG
jgi:Na+/proline symporter